MTSIGSRALVALVLLAGGAACDAAKSSESAAPAVAPPGAPAAAAQAPAVAAARALIAAGATVIDVREDDEWADGHLPSATLVPVGQVQDRLAEIERLAGSKDKPVVLYCASGNRAGKAKAALEAAGFTQVTNGGGYRALARP